MENARVREREMNVVPSAADSETDISVHFACTRS